MIDIFWIFFLELVLEINKLKLTNENKTALLMFFVVQKARIEPCFRLLTIKSAVFL